MSRYSQHCRAVVLVLAASVAFAAPAVAGGTALTLINGWENYSSATPSPTAYLINGVVHLKGAIKTSGNSITPFVLPPTLTPASNVFVKITLCNATSGRLDIESSGNVIVAADGNFSYAACLTSLDGASYGIAPDSFTPLTLKHHWTAARRYDVATPAIRLTDGVARFEGAISQDPFVSNPVPFVLPTKFRPATRVYLPIAMTNATNGRLIIDTDGTATLQAESAYVNAQGLTALDGAEFAVDSLGFTALSLINGWTGASGGTAAPAVRLLGSHIVQLRGAIANGTSADAFVLPLGYRPRRVVRVPVDLGLAKNGGLLIQADGTVTVQAEIDFADAQAFTSLDGVSFHI